MGVPEMKCTRRYGATCANFLKNSKQISTLSTIYGWERDYIVYYFKHGGSDQPQFFHQHLLLHHPCMKALIPLISNFFIRLHVTGSCIIDYLFEFVNLCLL